MLADREDILTNAELQQFNKMKSFDSNNFDATMDILDDNSQSREIYTEVCY
jgi:hypothetical protein